MYLLKQQEADIQIYYPLNNQGTSGSIIDASGLNNHLQLTGTTAPSWEPNSEGLRFKPGKFLQLNPIDLGKAEFIISFWYMQTTVGEQTI